MFWSHVGCQCAACTSNTTAQYSAKTERQYILVQEGLECDSAYTPPNLAAELRLFKIYGQYYHVRERTEVNRGPGLSADIIPLATRLPPVQEWAGTDATDRPSVSAPERKTAPPMMGQILPRFPNECLRIKRVGSLPRRLLPSSHGQCCYRELKQN